MGEGWGVGKPAPPTAYFPPDQRDVGANIMFFSDKIMHFNVSVKKKKPMRENGFMYADLYRENFS